MAGLSIRWAAQKSETQSRPMGRRCLLAGSIAVTVVGYSVLECGQGSRARFVERLSPVPLSQPLAPAHTALCVPAQLICVSVAPTRPVSHLQRTRQQIHSTSTGGRLAPRNKQEIPGLQHLEGSLGTDGRVESTW